MSDVVYQLDAIGGNKVEREAARAEKAMNGVQRGSSKAGMAILEASRGIEDFAMAGMRGVMNNIPGFLQNLGVGMGLTGVISVATIAVWKGVEALEAYRDKLHEARLAAAAIGVGTIDISNIAKEIEPQALKQVAEMVEHLKEMQSMQQIRDHQTGLDLNVSRAEEELKVKSEILWMELTMADEAERKAKAKEQSLRAAEKEAQVAKNQLGSSEFELNRLRAMKQALQEDANIDVQSEADKLNKKVRMFYATRAKELTGSVVKDIIPAGTGLGGYQPARTFERVIGAEEAEAMAKKEALKYEEELRKSEDERIRNLVLKSESAKKSLELLNTELDVAEKQFEKDKRSEEAAQRILGIKKKIIDAESTLLDIQEKNQERERQAKAMMKERVVDTSPFLTAQGRAGLSGNETQAALGIIGIARQQLTSLKKIERNTRNFTTAYA